ncbi:MAG: hypothetical protein J0H67_10375 [Rhodospirillales bacterium]|nr:hypothetical protein [Rhodospirillales bacterium]
MSIGLQHSAAFSAPRQDETVDRSARPARSGALANRLLLLVGAVAVPLLALGVWTLWDEYRTQRAGAERQLVEQARSLGRLVDGEFARTVSALSILAHSASLARGDLDQVAAELLAARSTLVDPDLQTNEAIRVRLLDTDGHLVLDTGLSNGTLGTVSAQPSAAVLAAIRTGRPQISDLTIGPLTRRPFVIAIVPVPKTSTLAAGWAQRAPPGAVAAGVPTAALRAILSEAGLPRGSIASIHDRLGHTVARSVPDDAAAGQPLPAALETAAARTDAGLLPETILGRNNEPQRIAFARASDSGFLVQLSVPERTFLAPLHEGLFRTAMIGMATLLMALLLSLAVARWIVSAFSRVPDLVRTSARSPQAAIRGTGLREADELAHALIRSERELYRLNLELELRVAQEVEARNEANVRAARAERLQALGQLAAGVAHDINNVLQAIQGGASLIQRQPANQALVMRLSGLISEAVARGANVTRRLLAFGRQGQLRVEPVALQELLPSMADLLRPALEPRVTLAIASMAELPPVRTDRGQLETVLVNLASNARDAMPEGGRIEITAVLEEIAPGTISPVSLAPGRYVCLRLTDTGTGMDAATLARAMEPFFTTKPLDKGAGLGLSMAKGFAEQSGGNLLLESTLGHGTSVRLWLPVATTPR